MSVPIGRGGFYREEVLRRQSTTWLVVAGFGWFLLAMLVIYTLRVASNKTPAEEDLRIARLEAAANTQLAINKELTKITDQHFETIKVLSDEVVKLKANRR